MNILIIGSGGRESAFAYKLSQSKRLQNLFIAPGNAGTGAYGKNVALKVTDFDGIASFVLENDVNMVLVGPEEPLVKGIHDYFLNRADLKHIPVIGPQQEGAQLEGSKDFSKQFMDRHGIPTAASRSFDKTNLEEGLAYLETQKLPIVLKADGLAAGKGVLICETLEDAKLELKAMIADSKFGAASDVVVVEEFLKGIELSVFVLTDGNSYKVLPSAKDYKRIGEGDTGLNTGGMGSISPVPFADEAFISKVEERIIKPTVEGLKKDNIPYKGFIFIGLMNVDGEPLVIEYNVRMGDPETESVLPRIESDLIDLLEGVAQGNLETRSYTVTPKTAVTVMLVAGGYPGNYESGKVISNIENVKESIVFHAGTSMQDGNVVTAGGRVIAVTTLQDTLFDALQQATADAGRIYFDGKYFRRDIGFDLI
ncbi:MULTISPECIES: phosphoribosylamine--glycine ligase [Sphingobacterium]|jgi:phosphoribosylamine--glycine ligase|uniref:Phosphoribosylamine--glycine ligase n=1 Tax=Sphingobacterium anhuiense TaxID=493780 RepID=A0ABW5YRT3_9SPHI|nr:MULTISPECIES: phosphoribosylamine--glycine ligase [Sphingobacterium]MCS3556651.1 phosphoribosylamine--glycine ligase [Sphingobacterium sp. JUb21]MCW2261751.1 phosphoribosylamine--glycine ligase [Sphingobacterium kitahiroshimense]NJI75481.1 phosphoribosylamine--glycine ligase [Sphingobacterium sp. B16(2022)]QQD15115.1 phosphoribosylamine--glycine ligase [Sphingobacterium sp. UDSM-2020]TCQ99473.1 phosphoribosylamine--glycine ligase [Sphingobacterium sp. JUb20]